MTTGRPPMTKDYSKVPLPSPTDDKYLALGKDGIQQPDGVISKNQFLHQNMKLIGILWKVLSTIYHSGDEPPDEQCSLSLEGDFKAMMEIDRSLEEFEAELPTVFTWKQPHPSTLDRTFRRQSNVLHARSVLRAKAIFT